VELQAGSPNQMIVRDDGSGLPPGFDARKNPGLGIELVLGMTKQIHGEVKIENDPTGGTRTTISFPSLPSSKAELQSQPTSYD
jgi:two-component sensor histidine kinase